MRVLQPIVTYEQLFITSVCIDCNAAVLGGSGQDWACSAEDQAGRRKFLCRKAAVGGLFLKVNALSQTSALFPSPMGSVLHVPITSLNPFVPIALSVCLSWLGRSCSSALPKELNYEHTTSPASAFSHSFETCE